MTNLARSIAFLIIAATLQGCLRSSSLLHSFNGITGQYVTQPLKDDSLKTATYAGATFNAGWANEMLTDGLVQMNLTLHQTFSFSKFTGYVGGSFMAGHRNVNRQGSFWNSTAQDEVDFYNANAGSMGTMGYGIDAGIAFVQPLGFNGSEWRILGIESSYRKDFGGYNRFRKQQVNATSIIRYNDQSDYFSSFGFTTEVIVQSQYKNNRVGYKFAIGRSFKDIYYTGLPPSNNNAFLRPVYISNTLHVGDKKFTFFLQNNIATYSFIFFAGLQYRLNGW